MAQARETKYPAPAVAAASRSGPPGRRAACDLCAGRRTSLARANARGRDWRGASSQRLVQPVQQPRPRLDRGNIELLVMGMRAFAVDAEPVKGRRQRCGKIAVG